jgi:hypothetical protein
MISSHKTTITVIAETSLLLVQISLVLKENKIDKTCCQQCSIHSLVHEIAMKREGAITEYKLEVHSQSASEKAALNRGLSRGYPKEIVGGKGEVSSTS